MAFRDLPFGVRVYTTSLCRIFASLGLSGADVYANLLFGEEWYGTVKLDAMPARVIVHERGTSGVYDPLDQVMTVSNLAVTKALKFTQRPDRQRVSEALAIAA